MTVGDVWCRLTVFGPDGSALGRWTLRGCGAPDLAAIDHVARLRLEVGRHGGSIAMSDVSAQLDALLELVGLRRLRGQMSGQAEGREQPVGVQERVDRTDPSG